MKSRAGFPAALAVGVLCLASASNAHAFELLDRILSHGGCGCDAAPSCCAPRCGHRLHFHLNRCCEPKCGCEVTCGVEPKCGVAPSCGCDKACCDPCCRRTPIRDLFARAPCCRPSCCEATCGAEPKCGVAPSCGCDKACDPCCRPKRCGGLLKKIMSCRPSCCEPACGVEPSCGCGA